MENFDHVEITRVLRQFNEGIPGAEKELYELVYQELKDLARRQLAKERPGHTLRTTGLVHEAYLRLANGNSTWENRRHFYGAAAKAMRRVLVDHARKIAAKRRGGDRRRIPLEAVPTHLEPGLDAIDDLLAVDSSLSKLEKVNPRTARIVTLRYFVGMSVAETATALELSPRTVNYEWKHAKAWLRRELSTVRREGEAS